jgi:hypothetical protein
LDALTLFEELKSELTTVRTPNHVTVHVSVDAPLVKDDLLRG